MKRCYSREQLQQTEEKKKNTSIYQSKDDDLDEISFEDNLELFFSQQCKRTGKTIDLRCIGGNIMARTNKPLMRMNCGNRWQRSVVQKDKIWSFLRVSKNVKINAERLKHIF